MGDTWITDITHFLTRDGAIAPTAEPARRFAEFLAKLAVDATTPSLDGSTHTSVRCRRRPARKLCTGEIETDIDAETEEIVWWCPACGDNGIIRNWKGSMWDCTNDAKAH